MLGWISLEHEPSCRNQARRDRAERSARISSGRSMNTTRWPSAAALWATACSLRMLGDQVLFEQITSSTPLPPKLAEDGLHRLR